MPIVHGKVNFREGPLVQVRIGVGSARRRAFIRLHRACKEPISTFAQIDTGSHRSGVDSRLLRELGLDGPVDYENVFTTSTDEEPHPAPRYLVNYTIVGPEGALTIPDMFVLAFTFHPNDQAQAILGRDILDKCVLQYFGHDRAFTLAFDC